MTYNTKKRKSLESHAILDKKSRKQKAEKIISVLGKNKNLERSTILDIGTGSGYIAGCLSKHSRNVTSVDLVDERLVNKGFKFQIVKSETLPFGSETFDIVISNHVIEHVNNQEKHFNEILRVLKNGGVAYVATPNRLWLIDPHYRIPLINWLPSFVVKNLFRLFRKKWDIKPLSPVYFYKKRSKKIKVVNYTAKILSEPHKYKLDYPSFVIKILRLLPLRFVYLFSFFSPTVIYILKNGSPNKTDRNETIGNK